MDSESADILGGRLPVTRDASTTFWLSQNWVSITGLVLGGFLLLVFWHYFAPWYRQYREKNYRKMMRRRYGIPDNDYRPFNVAYSAAQHARQEAEESAPFGRGSIKPQSLFSSSSQSRAVQDPQAAHTRQRLNYTEHRDSHQYPSSVTPVVGMSGSQVPVSRDRDYIRDESVLDSYGNRHIHTAPSRSPEKSESRPLSVHARSDRRGKQNAQFISEPAYGKRAFQQEDEVEDEKEPKKSRLEDNELIDGDEDAEWNEPEGEIDADMDVDEQEALINPKRGSKRVPSREDDESIESTRANGRDKRARKVSRDKAGDQVIDHEMEDADEITELESVPRGKKRDRGEAGSVFGGDESLLDEDEDKTHRHRRRRTASHKKVDASARGQKRTRENIESVDSDEEEDDSSTRHITRKKRGKKGPENDVDLSMDDGMVSHDPLCKGRRIGEEWEANGVLYKVGPNGQRLRQALVKKSRSRFPMPKDSQHPDRSANIDVFVETWLSDEEYQLAKDRHELAWQDSPRQTVEPETPGNVPDYPISPTKAGKNLLWSSTSSKESPVPRRPFRQSIATNVGLRLNPFQDLQPASGRRISSFHSIAAPPDSPKLRTAKSYSKWEKQDLEAAAMSKLREKIKSLTPPAIEQKLPAPRTVPVVSSPLSTASKPATIAAEVKAPSTFSFAPPPPASTTTAKATPSDLPNLMIPSSTVKPSAPTEPAKSTLSFPSKPVPSSTTTQPKPSTASPFTFGINTSTTSNAPATFTANVPNFFARPSAPAAPAAPPTSTSFSLNAPAQTSAAPKSAFSFAAPPAQSSTTSTPIFGGAQHAKKPEPVQASAPATGGSLLSRLGGIAGAQPTSNASPGVTGPSSTSTASFPFGKPSAPASAFGFTTSAQTQGASSAPSTASSRPRFNFGLGLSKPVNPSPVPTVNAGAPDTSKPTVPTFGFGPPTTTGSSVAAAPSASSQPKFSFGFGSSSHTPTGSTTGTGTGFGGSAGASSALKDATTTPKSVFAFGAPGGTIGNAFVPIPTTSAGTSAFGNAINSAPSSGKPTFSFGTPGSSSGAAPTLAFGTAPFGGQTDGASKSAFSFGAPSQSPAPVAKANEGQSTSGFSFPFGAAPPPSSSTSPTPATFGFGAPAANPAAGSNPTGAPAFGSAQPTPTTFGFGAPSSSSNGTSAFNFGTSSK